MRILFLAFVLAGCALVGKPTVEPVYYKLECGEDSHGQITIPGGVNVSWTGTLIVESHGKALYVVDPETGETRKVDPESEFHRRILDGSSSSR